MLLYADDAKISYLVNSNETCAELQDNFNKFCSWCADSDLVLNNNKCKIVSYIKKSIIVDYPHQIYSTVLERLDSVEDLGIIFDKNFSFILNSLLHQP